MTATAILPTMATDRRRNQDEGWGEGGRDLLHLRPVRSSFGSSYRVTVCTIRFIEAEEVAYPGRLPGSLSIMLVSWGEGLATVTLASRVSSQDANV